MLSQILKSTKTKHEKTDTFHLDQNMIAQHFLYFLFTAATVMETVSSSQLRGSWESISVNNGVLKRDLKSLPLENGCRNFFSLVTFRSDVPTTIYYRASGGFIGSQNPDNLADDYKTEWILDPHPCPDASPFYSSSQTCYTISSAFNGVRWFYAGSQVENFGGGVYDDQLWFLEKASGNRVALYNAVHGNIVLPSSSGQARQLRYGKNDYPLDDKYWIMDEARYCLN